MIEHTDRFEDTLTVEGGTFQINGGVSVTLTSDQRADLADALAHDEGYSTNSSAETRVEFLPYAEEEDEDVGEIGVAGSPESWRIVMIPKAVRDNLIKELIGSKAFRPLSDVSMREVVESAQTEDLKPRGVKRQWWLFPFDAWAAVERAESQPLMEILASDASKIAGSTLAILDVFSDECGGVLTARDLVCQVLEHGAAKYSPDNWRFAADDLIAFRREYFSAMARHCFSHDQGEYLDSDSGLPHLAHAICCGLFWTWHEMRERGEVLGSGAFFQ